MDWTKLSNLGGKGKTKVKSWNLKENLNNKKINEKRKKLLQQKL